MSLLEEHSVVVGLRAIDADDFFSPILRETIDEELRLQLAHLHVVEGHIKIEIAIGDQAIVGEHGNTGVVRHVDGLCHGPAIVRNDHKHIYVPANQRLNIADLPGVIAVGRLDQYLRAELPGTRHKQIAISLPPFLFQGVHRKTDERFRAGSDPLRDGPSAGKDEAGNQANSTRSNNQENPKFH